MEAVSAVKMRKGQERALQNRSYAEAALRILSRVSRSFDLVKSVYMEDRGNTKVGVVVVTSDKGLAGNHNSAVLKVFNRALSDKNPEDVITFCLGKKGYEHCLREGYTVAVQNLNVSDEVVIEDMQEITEAVLKMYNNNEIDKVKIAYQQFQSTFNQEPVVQQILPLQREVIDTMIKSLVPKEGKYSDVVMDERNIAYTVEPDGESVLQALLPQLVQIMIYHSLLEAKASEHSARMVAMKNASDKALEVSNLLKLKFNKERQAVITREVSEIAGGIEAMAQK